MTESYTYNGTDLRIIRAGTVELTEHADHGEIGTGRFTIDDEAGTYDIVGHKSFTADQSACSVVRTFTGYIGSREYQRNIEKVGAARTIDVSTLDLNARFGFKIIRGRSWNRPRETIGERMTALLASSFLSGLVADYGFVDYPTDEMDKNDYRGQFPLDVIRDCALPVGYNYFVYWSEADAAAGLWFRDSNASTAFSSTLRLSNVASDIDDSTTFAVGQETTLERDPSEVISGVLVPFTKGNVYRTRSATASNFQARDGMAPNSQIKKRAKAVTLGDRFLFERRNEEDVIRTTMLAVPNTKVNLVRAGQRIEAKFSHFATEGYGDFSWFRILEATKKPINAEGALYDIPLTLSPQEATCGPSTIVQQKETSGVGNVDITLDANPTIGNLLIAIGMRKPSGGANVPAAMNAAEGWTEITQVHVDDCCGNPGSAGYAFAFYKVVDDTSPIWSRVSESAQYQWRLYELANADPANISVVSVDNDGSHAGGLSATLTVGTFSNAQGVSIMCEIVGRGTDQSATAGAFGMGSWTERFDDQFDPTVGDPKPSPWFGIGDATTSGTSLAGSWVYTESGQGNPDQSIGNWAGIALNFGGTNCT